MYICILNTCVSDYKGKDHFTVNWSVLKDITVGQKLKPKMFYSRYLILGTVVAFKPHVKVPSTKYAVSRADYCPGARRYRYLTQMAIVSPRGAMSVGASV